MTFAFIARADVSVADPAAQLERGERVILRNIYFDAGKATLKPESDEPLKAIAKALADHPKLALTIEVHSDERGADDYNLKMSQARAQAIVAWLMAQGGIPLARLTAVGRGETAPICHEHNEACWSQNRRVELVRRL